MSQLIDGAEPWGARMEAVGSGPSCSGPATPRPSRGVEEMGKPQASAWGFSGLQRVQKACPGPSRAQGNEKLSSVWKEEWPPVRRVSAGTYLPDEFCQPAGSRFQSGKCARQPLPQLLVQLYQLLQASLAPGTGRQVALKRLSFLSLEDASEVVFNPVTRAHTLFFVSFRHQEPGQQRIKNR